MNVMLSDIIKLATDETIITTIRDSISRTLSKQLYLNTNSLISKQWKITELHYRKLLNVVFWFGVFFFLASTEKKGVMDYTFPHTAER